MCFENGAKVQLWTKKQNRSIHCADCSCSCGIWSKVCFQGKKASLLFISGISVLYGSSEKADSCQRKHRKADSRNHRTCRHTVHAAAETKTSVSVERIQQRIHRDIDRLMQSRREMLEEEAYLREAEELLKLAARVSVCLCLFDTRDFRMLLSCILLTSWILGLWKVNCVVDKVWFEKKNRSWSLISIVLWQML